MKKLIVFFYVDALNSSFLVPSIMPFLSAFAKDHCYQELQNVAGYSFAIQSCMLSGKYPEENNHWMPYFYSPKNSSMLFKAFGKVGSVLPLDSVPTLRYLAMGQLRRFVLKKGVRPNNIPTPVVDKMNVYPYYYMCELPFFHELEQLLEMKFRASLTYIGPPAIKTHIYGPLLRHVQTSNNESEFIIAYDDRLDMLGHSFGPNSLECLNYAKSLDVTLLRVYQELKRRFRDKLKFVVFSDHGQCEQTYDVDLLSELDKNRFRLGDDYLCFIDATLALFWPKSAVIKEKILRVLNGINMGTVIDEDLKKQYHIKFKDEKYGEIFFVLKPGGTFFPNFFSPLSAMKGLHGYLPKDDVQKSFVISESLSIPFKHVKDFRDFSLGASSSWS